MLLTFSNSAKSASHPIIEIKFHFNNTDRIMYVELFDDTSPLTAANYLDYVTSIDGDGLPKYDGTFVYRNAPGFVLQMGGYTFRPPNPLVDALISPFVPVPVGLTQVADGLLSPVTNEFNLSNTRGTISMAKIAAQFVEGGSCVVAGPGCTLIAGTGPDTATKEWFINLSDNTQLDSLNGGFTVFGRIIDDGIKIADEISTFPDRPFAGQVLNADFTHLPVVNYDVSSLPAVLQEHLVMITSITSNITRPILRYAPENANFGLDVANDGNSPLKTITVKNTGNETLKVSSVNSANLLQPFTIFSENCSTTLTLDPISTNPSSSCSIEILYAPTSAGKHAGEITIDYTNASGTTAYTATLDVSGEGVPQTPILTVSDTNIAFEDTTRNSASGKSTVIIQNKGGDPLNFNLINITGTNSSDFTISSNNCITTLTISETCEIGVTFNPTVAGQRTAALSIQTDGGNIDVALSGLSTIPVISVDASIEIKAQVGNSASKFLAVTNTGTENLIIDNLIISGPDATLFSQENNCPDTNNSPVDTSPLNPDGKCNILIKFSPISNANSSAILTIESNDPDTPSIDITLTGTLGEPLIFVNNAVDLGTVQINGNSSVKELKVTNNGNTPLAVTNILGLDTTRFSQTNTCSNIDNRTAPNATCSIFITFNTDSPGTQTAVMVIESNDPVTPLVNVTLTGFGDNDSDGIPSSVEASSPNSGDGNNDAISDDVQNDVASLLASNSKYVTFISDKSKLISILTNARIPTTLTDVTLLDTTPTDNPINATFDYGLYSYSITFPKQGEVINDINLGNILMTEDVVGDAVDVAILLPSGEKPTEFYKYGPTPNDPTPHWYDFAYDATTLTGAQFIGNVTFQSPSGIGIQRNFVIISYIDGQRGDDDLTANGVILNDKAGLSFTQSESSGSSGSLFYLPLLLLLITNLCRYNAFHKFIRNTHIN